MTKFGPFLLFDGNCADAMEFYKACFGGELTLTRVKDTPMKAQYPEDKQDRVLNAQLKSDLIEITATDWMKTDRQPKVGNTVALYISEAPYAELKKYFDKLSDGANPNLLDELVDMPFGTYGHLCDKYGVHWFFQGDKSTAAQ